MTDTAAADAEILQLLQDNVSTGAGTAIVYVASRRRSEELAEAVAGLGISAAHYHGSMARKLREATHAAFLTVRCRSWSPPTLSVSASTSRTCG